MTDNKKIRSTLSKKVKKTKDSFHTAYNKHTIYMYIVVALVLTFIVEMIAGIAAFDHSKMYGVYFLIGSPYVDNTWSYQRCACGNKGNTTYCIRFQIN